jgi:hypothetical protein
LGKNNTFPSPLQANRDKPAVAASAVEEKPLEVAAPKKKRNLPKVQLKRKSEDVLNIDHTQELPHMTITRSKVKMDVNTGWVEMLIHSEQMKLKPA